MVCIGTTMGAQAKAEVMVTRGPLSQDTAMLDSQGVDTASLADLVRER